MSSEIEDLSHLPVAIDCMGADLGSGVVVEGAVAAAKELQIPSILVGREEEINSHLKRLGCLENPNIQIRNAGSVIEMQDSPGSAVRRKPDASIRVAFELVKSRDASAVVSPGNTGAVMAAGIFVSGTLPGIARPAIASLLPKVGDKTPTVLLDSGANIDCNASQLVHFALMGNYYAQVVIGSDNPRVALLSNGSEPSKGTDIIRSAAQLLSEMEELNFIGFVEGRDVCKDKADVIVCDGFVGNVLLKTMEGGVELVFDSIRHYVEKSLRGKIGIWMAKPLFRTLFRDKLNPSAYGGAPLLGLNDVAIVCHGSADSRAIMNAIRVAKLSAEQSLARSLNSAMATLDLRSSGEFQDGIWNRMSQRFEKKQKPQEAKTPKPE